MISESFDSFEVLKLHFIFGPQKHKKKAANHTSTAPVICLDHVPLGKQHIIGLFRPTSFSLTSLVRPHSFSSQRIHTQQWLCLQ